MKTIVIYHRADFDGIFCREIARKFLPYAELIGWDYGDPIPNIYRDVVPVDIQLYMLDISVEGLMDHPGLIWIDHHKSAIEKYGHRNGFQLDGVAACRLAWNYFSNKHTEDEEPFPTKDDFVNRLVIEPLAIRLAGEYDIWDKRDPDAEVFQHGLRSQPITAQGWKLLLQNDEQGNSFTRALLLQGRNLQYFQTEQNASIINAFGFDVDFEGLHFLACNHARFNSLLFTAGVKPEHDALLGFNWDGPKREWRVSLYHAPGKEHHDLSQIAVKYGGGGHRGACGFRVKTLPFLK